MSTTAADRAVDVVREIYAALARGGVAHVLESLPDDVEIFQTPLLPWGGIYRGAAGARAFFGALRAHVESRVWIERFIEAGDDVVVIGRTVGRVRATGRPFDVAVAHVWTVRDGRVRQLEAYIDTPAMLDALDVRDA